MQKGANVDKMLISHTFPCFDVCEEVNIWSVRKVSLLFHKNIFQTAILLYVVALIIIRVASKELVIRK